MVENTNFDNHEDQESLPLTGATRHALIISSTFPAWLLMSLFFVFRWVLISGERAGSFRDTAIGFAIAGVILGAINISIRRRL